MATNFANILKARPALSVSRNTSLGSAVNFALAKDVRVIEINAENQAVYVRFTTGVTTTVFDAYVLPGQTKQFRDINVDFGGSISVLEAAAGAIVTVIQYED